jgi:hypothetical protein
MSAGNPQVDPVSGRPHHRLTTLHALTVDGAALDRFDGDGGDFGRVGDYLRFGRLSPYYQGSGNQFPSVLVFQEHVRCPFVGLRHDDGVKILQCRTWLFRVPHGGLVAGVTLDFDGDLRASIPLLEDAYYGEVTIGGHTLLDVITAAAVSSVAACLDGAQLSTHGHQLLFTAGKNGELVEAEEPATRTLDHDLIRRLIYRFDTPYRPDSGLVRFPAEVNRNLASLAACGPYFSLFASQQDYVENSALVTAVQLVGSAALLSGTRTHAYAALGDLRRLHAEIDSAESVDYRHVRRHLADLSERVGRLELDLSFGIEAYHEIAALVPSLRISDLHRELFDAAALPDQSRSISQMLDRLGRAVAAEAASVVASERSRDERRRLIWGVAIGFASFIAIPLTLIFGFFAVTTTDVSHNTSLLEVGRYKWLYATVGGVMLVTLCLALGVWLATRDRD